MRFLVTGACGFAGSHMVEEICHNPDNEIVALDCLTYAAKLDQLGSIASGAIKFIYHDFRHPLTEEKLTEIGHVDYIIHNGAESHVARSFDNPRLFAESNIMGTLNMLEAARKLKPSKFVYVSTDEVFGPSYGQAYKETDPLNPTNPYSASKAAGEYLTYSYFRSFGLPAIITRTMNMYGEYQHPEKYIPKAIRQILHNEVVKVERSPYGEMGSRHWVYAGEQAQAILYLCEHGVSGESYNISSGVEKSNLEIAQLIAQILNCPLGYETVVPTIAAHDLHYSIDDSKLRREWQTRIDFEGSFRKTVLWFAEHQEYLEG